MSTKACITCIVETVFFDSIQLVTSNNSNCIVFINKCVSMATLLSNVLLRKKQKKHISY